MSGASSGFAVPSHRSPELEEDITVRTKSTWRLAAIVATAATITSACAEDAPQAGATLLAPVTASHVGCPAATKFTGGGRIDPGPSTMTGKVTFGFNIHAGADCGDIKGQLQVVHHPTQTKFHTTDIHRYASWIEDDGGECGEFSGKVRVKHKNEDWHTHDFETQFCDYGEPGSSTAGGRDRWRFEIQSDASPGHGSTSLMLLTGGNIQAH
jgi:hypothetical protein